MANAAKSSTTANGRPLPIPNIPTMPNRRNAAKSTNEVKTAPAARRAWSLNSLPNCPSPPLSERPS